MRQLKGACLATAGLLAMLASPSIAQDQLSFVVGTQGGTMDRLGAGLTEVFNKNHDDVKINTIPGGAAVNPARIAAGDTDIGMTFSNFAKQAYNGEGDFDQAYKNLRHVVTFWGSCFKQFIDKDLYDSGIKTYDDLVASEEPLSVGMAQPGSSAHKMNAAILDALGSSFEDLENRGFKLAYTGAGQLAQQYRSGQIDIFFINSGDPHAAGVEAALARDLTFMDLSEKAKTALQKLGFRPCTIPGGIYENVDEDHASMGAFGVVVAKEEVDPQIIYDFLKTTYDNMDYLSGVHKIFAEWTPEYGVADYGVPLHEGAERFYKEIGVLN